MFSWFFDVTTQGIVRTANASPTDAVDYGLKRTDYVILAALAAVSLAVVYGGYEKVRQSATAEMAASIKDSNSIAVLPFVNLDDDADTEYFSDGVTEEILHWLSAFKSLRVLGRASSFSFKSSDMTIPRISDILRVRYLLQGSVRRDVDQIRVTAQLVDESGFQVWSEIFDRKLEGVFSIQTDIANSVAQQLVAEIAPRESSTGSTTSNIETYQEYLVGRAYVHGRKPRWQQSASAAFLRAIELDPDFAPPYAGLAMTTSISASHNPAAYSERLATAQQYADRALELDSELAEAHAALGLILFSGQNADFAAAESALRRAIDLDPSVVIAYNWLGIALSSQGKHEESWEAKQDALRIDPLNPIINSNVALVYQSRGDFHRAERLYLRLMELPEPPGTAYGGLQTLYENYGRMVDANTWAKKIVVAYHERGSVAGYNMLSINYRYLGMFEEADYWLGMAAKSDSNGMRSYFRKCHALKLEGKYDEMKRLTDEFLQQTPVDQSKLPVFWAEVMGAIKISIGDYDEGIALTERVVHPDKPLSTTSGGGLDAIDFMHELAFAYVQTDQNDKADNLLQKAAMLLQP